ncbi:Protein Piccolo [Manis pentadactyla]|nr:Protein Piccolo [Manis pentadactyla]
MPDASGYVERTETLALRKELGSWSDVARECKMLEQGYGECEGRVTGLGSHIVDINGEGENIWSMDRV